MKIKKITILFLILNIGITTDAQSFLWDINFRFQFDNREYNGTLTDPQTLFGSKLTPEIGIGWGSPTAKKGLNALMIGVDVTTNFGADIFNTTPELIVYYTFRSPRFNAYAGVLPKQKMIGSYSNLLFSDSVRFYDANIEGLLLQYTDPWGYIEFGCDWNSMYSKDRHEKFLLFSTGEFKYKWFRMGYEFSMHHYAGSVTVRGVTDNILANPFVGVNLTEIVPLDNLSLKLAYIQAYQWDRNNDVQHFPHGVQIDFRIEKWGVGIYDACYLGDNMMVYYEKFGTALYWGEPYYRTNDKIYNRLEIYYQLVNRLDLDVRIRSVHHFEGSHWAWQQLVSIGVNLDNDFFGKIKKKPNNKEPYSSLK